MKNLFALLIVSFTFTASSIAQDGYKVGDKARDFKLLNIDGNKISLKDYRDTEGYIIIFTCNHCPYAKLYEDRIISLHNKYAKQGFPVIAINPNDPEIQPEDSYENMRKRAREKAFPFAYLWDETQDIAKTYGATKTPHVYLLKNDGGEYKVAYIGAIDDNPNNPKGVQTLYLEEAIAALKAGKDPEPSETKSIGCSIKWRE